MARVSDFQIKCGNPARDSKGILPSRRAALFNHWDGKCAYCGDRLNAARFDIDHVINGPHTGCHHGVCNLTWNTVPVHHTCNVQKGFTGGNFITYMAHVALDKALVSGASIEDTITNELTRFTDRLYTPIAGYEKDFVSFVGPEVLKTAYILVKDGNTYSPQGL